MGGGDQLLGVRAGLLPKACGKSIAVIVQDTAVGAEPPFALRQRSQPLRPAAAHKVFSLPHSWDYPNHGLAEGLALGIPGQRTRASSKPKTRAITGFRLCCPTMRIARSQLRPAAGRDGAQDCAGEEHRVRIDGGAARRDGADEADIAARSPPISTIAAASRRRLPPPRAARPGLA